jgi:hypothetical protein
MNISNNQQNQVAKANDSDNTQTSSPSVPPKSFPTHNPAMQHRQFMSGVGGNSNSGIGETNNVVGDSNKTDDFNKASVSTTLNSNDTKATIGTNATVSSKFPDPTKNLTKIAHDVVESDAHQKEAEASSNEKMIMITLGIGVLALLIIAVGMFLFLIY